MTDQRQFKTCVYVGWIGGYACNCIHDVSVGCQGGSARGTNQIKTLVTRMDR